MRSLLVFMLLGFLVPLPLHANEKQPLEIVRIEGLAEQIVGEQVIYEVYRKAGIPVTIMPMPAKRAHFETAFDDKDGEMLRIGSYGKTNPGLIRIPIPIGYIETQAFARKGFQLEQSQKSDYTYAVVRGVQHTHDATATFGDVVELSHPAAMLAFVSYGRAQVALSSLLDGHYQLMLQNIFNVVPVGEPWARHPLFHYVHERHESIIPKLTEAIALMKASGELEYHWNKAVDELLSHHAPSEQDK